MAYDEAWTFTGTILIAGDAFDAVKKIAISKGLFEESTGITAELAKVVSAEQAVAKAKPTEVQEKRIALLDAVNAASVTVRQWSPMTNPHGDQKKVCEHKGMVMYCVQLSTMLRAKADDVDMGPVDTTTGKRDSTKSAGVTDACLKWAPVKPASLVAADFKANFDDATKKCNLQIKDSGVEDALKAAAKATANGDMQSTDKQKQRKARMAAKEAYDHLVKALNSFWTECGPVAQMRALVTAMLQEAAVTLRGLDAELFGSKMTWPNNPLPGKSDDEKFSAAVWVDALSKAEKDGVTVAGKGDPAGVGKALLAAGNKIKTEAALGTAQSQDRVKLRKECKMALTKVFTSASKYAGAQKQMIEDLAKYVTFIANHARKKMGEYEAAQNKVVFKPTKTNLVATEIRESYNGAKNAGAIEPNDGLVKKFESAVKDFLETEIKFKAETDLEKKRKLALTLQGNLAKMRQQAAEFAGEYGEHESFGPYANSMQVSANAGGRSEAIDKCLQGELPGQDFPATAFVWKDGDWQKAKKVAIGKGLLTDAKTNFGDSLTKAKKAFDEGQKRKAKRPRATNMPR